MTGALADRTREQRDRVEHDLTEAAQVMTAERLRITSRRGRWGAGPPG